MSLDEALSALDFGDDGLVPAVAQDCKTGEIRMLAYMNEEAFRRTVRTKYAHYWSRSREELWKKGETSGHVQKVQEIRSDCDRDAVLLLVEQEGVACHTGERNCFFNRLEDGEWIKDEPFPDHSLGEILVEIQRIIRDRDRNRPDDSYTVQLLTGGGKDPEDYVLEKLGEEFTETLLAAKNDSEVNFKQETGDFFYHLLVLLRLKDLKLRDLVDPLSERLPS